MFEQDNFFNCFASAIVSVILGATRIAFLLSQDQKDEAENAVFSSVNYGAAH